MNITLEQLKLLEYANNSDSPNIQWKTRYEKFNNNVCSAAFPYETSNDMLSVEVALREVCIINNM